MNDKPTPQREARNHQIQNSLDMVNKSAKRLEELLLELKGECEAPEKTPTVDPSVPPMAELLAKLPEHLRGLSERFNQLRSEIREVIL